MCVKYSARIENLCSGNLCGIQRVTDWLVIKGFVFYGLSTNSICLFIQHKISVQTATYGSFQIYDFSSLKFSKLYMRAYIPGLWKLYMFQLTKASMNVLTDWENYIWFINDNSGFTVVGWYKRGVINEKSLIAYQK